MKWLAIALGLGLLCGAPAQAQVRAVSVQAVCMDARGLPHPAAQTFAQRDVAADYQGELFRCLPGTAMRYVVESYNHDCAAGEALWYEEHGLSCRTETSLSAEQERELLRSFGPGEKRVDIAAEPAPQSQRGTPRYRYGWSN
jgi:hypothetical protein